MTIVRIKSGDTGTYTSTLTIDGVVVNLTGASVSFLLRLVESPGTAYSFPATIVSAVAGTVSYTSDGGFPTVAGKYRQEWQATLSSGRVVTFPNSSPEYNYVIILDRIGSGWTQTVPEISNITAYWPMGNNAGGVLIERVSQSFGTAALPPPQPSSVDFAIGTNAVGGQATTGSLAQWGHWHRLHTAAEKAAIAGGEKSPFYTTSLNDAAAYYLLDEASAASTFADATGRGNTLTKAGAGSTTRVTGPGGVGYAAQFAGDCRLARAANADLRVGNKSYSACGWVKLDSKAGTQQIFFGQATLSPLNIGFVVYYHTPNDRFQADFGAGDVGGLHQNAVVVANEFGSPSTGVWYFLHFEYDSNEKTISLSVNNGTANSLSVDLQPEPVTGHIVTATQFKPTPQFVSDSGWDSEGVCHYSIANSANVTFGDRDRMVWMWVYLDSTATQTIMGYYDTNGTKIDWLFQYYLGEIYFYIGNNAGGFDFAKVAITLDEWHLVVGWYDKTGDGKIHIDLDNGSATDESSVLVITPAQTSQPILMGADIRTASDTYGNQFMGRLEGIGMASIAATAADIDYLWNDGNGIG